MIIKLHDSIIKFPEEELTEIISTILDLAKYHKDAFFISSALLRNTINKLSNNQKAIIIVNKLKQLDIKYSTIMSIHSENNRNYLIISNSLNVLYAEFFIDGESHFKSSVSIRELVDKIINIQFYFENQTDGEFLEAVIKTKFYNNNMFNRKVIQPAGGNTIIDKYEKSLQDNMLWVFVVDEDICIDNIRIKDSNSKKCDDLSERYYSFSYHMTTLSRSIENLIPKEIIDIYLEDYNKACRREKYDELLNNQDIQKGYFFREGMRKDLKPSIRLSLHQKWRELTGIHCDSLNDKCIESKMCPVYDLSDIIFSGVSVGSNNLVLYATKKIANRYEFDLTGNLKTIVHKIYDLAASNSDLSEMLWSI